jgi:ribose transport system substrate-binding protein
MCKKSLLKLVGCLLLICLAALFGVSFPSSSEAASDLVTGKTDMSRTTSENLYKPQGNKYYFAYTYKLVHPWYDAIKVGLDQAVKDYAAKGVTITYDYTAPVGADAVAQLNMIEQAAAKNPAVIAVDVTQADVVVPIMNELMDKGVKILTFSGGDADASQGCKRIAFVGNTDNKGDGAKLAEELAKAINYEGEVACLDGSIGASSHEERIVGFNEVMAKYPKIKVVDRQRDDDDLENAVKLTENMLQKHPNLKGIWCNNMTNPIGAAQAVDAAGKGDKIIIVGMDHDLRALEYLKKGVIYCLQVQNNYDMGYKLIETSLQAADGLTVGNGIEAEKYNVGSTTVFQERAQEFIDLLYGNN